MFVLPVAPELITCVLLPRFELVVAAGGRTELVGVPVAIAPEPGSQQIGAVSAAAEAFGVSPRMRLGEALARCQRLTLIPPDPAGVDERWEQMLIALESIGAAVEPLRPGLVCFDARGLLRLYAARGGLAVDRLHSGRTSRLCWQPPAGRSMRPRASGWRRHALPRWRQRRGHGHASR